MYYLMLAVLASSAVVCSGCASSRAVSRGMRHAGEAVRKAAFSPETFMPLAAAGVVHAARADDDISEWASSRAPVFGSRENADRWSNITLGGAHAANIAALLAADDGKDPRAWVSGKLRRFAAGLAAGELTYASTGLLKTNSCRPRPDGSDHLSFPSGHASDAALNAALAGHNLSRAPAPWGGAPALHAGILSLSAATAWARVEAKKHYPTDVLCGAALGNFIGVFVSGLFNGSPSLVRVQSGPESFSVLVRTEFE